MRRKAWSVVTTVLFLSVQLGNAGAFQAPRPDGDLETGIRQVREGEFDAALITLDSVVRRLGADAARTKELSRAYVYLSIAYFGLEQTENAKAKFIEALQLNKDLEITTKEFPPKVVDFFNQVRTESQRLAASTVDNSPGPATPSSSPRPPTKDATKKGGSKMPLVLLGVAGAAGGAALAARSGGTASGGTNAASATYDIRGVWRLNFSWSDPSLIGSSFSATCTFSGGTTQGTLHCIEIQEDTSWSVSGLSVTWGPGPGGTLWRGSFSDQNSMSGTQMETRSPELSGRPNFSGTWNATRQR